ncbi:tetratricopeptide TPR_4 [Cellulomonas flavigena DSM 20109]|uniref:Tetratricopeptide TPR_4 n=1 Tax=Cellulomonas flavigena (strain ATCC 482 / DSM 20109 / BCRC 11376 / JCM 18109 / NBRC 3775 / NCIMB 8073 / NRS 134) TaxID=446466 RepID=D5UH95_CELFN|nr:hypothetical protein [Cellulomonas flavigena]ADG73298.1 tetratricopeptide TPR_4 [Cellulomonas flavigena DSM 20109]
MVTGADVREILRTASALPFGRSRTQLVEEAVRAAEDVGDAVLLTQARLDLHEACHLGGERRKSLLPFSQVLRDYDAATHHFSRALTDRVLWQSKWAASTLTGFPEVPLGHTEQLLEAMEARARAAGHGVQAVAWSRVNLTWRVHGAAAAQEQFRRWRTLPRDATSDCLACELSATAELLHDLGDDEAGLEVSARVRCRDVTCDTQPQRALGAALLPLVRTGRLAEAADHHRRCLSGVRGRSLSHMVLAQNLLFLALTGNEARGVELLQSQIAAIDVITYQLEAAVARLLSGATARTGDGIVLTLSDGEQMSAEDLARRSVDAARREGEKFDARNGTTTVSERIEQVLAASPLPHVPLPA